MPLNSTPLHLSHATQALHEGGVIAYPTEAIWGLGCDPHNERAVLRLLTLKQRDWQKGLILVAADMAQLQPYLHGLNPLQLQTLSDSWPGAHTWLVPNNGAAPKWISGGRTTLAVRVSAHPVVVALCQKFGGSIVSTSANVAGTPPAKTASDVLHYFGKQLDYVMLGALGDLQNPTLIRDLVTGEIIRPA